MRRHVIVLFVAAFFVVGLFAAAAAANELVFVGAACSDSWHSDLYLAGDASAFPGPQTATITFIPFQDASTSYSVAVEIQGGDQGWESWAPDILCTQIPAATGLTGTLVVDLPWDVDGWMRTWSPPGFGQTILPGESLDYSTWYRVPTYDAVRFRCNLLLYNAGPGYSILQVGAGWQFLEPGEAAQILDIPGGTTVVLVSGGTTYATLSLVDNATNDGSTIPLLEAPGGP